MRSELSAASVKRDSSPELSRLGLQHLKGSLESPPGLSQGRLYCSQLLFGISLALPFPGFAAHLSSLTQLLPKPVSQQPWALPGESPTAPPVQPLAPDAGGRWQQLPPTPQEADAGFEQLQQSRKSQNTDIAAHLPAPAPFKPLLAGRGGRGRAAMGANISEG